MGDPTRFDSLKTVGKYALIEKLGDGYLGPIFKSFNKDRDRAVEIRVFCDGIKWDEDLKGLMRKECESLARLKHLNIASIIELHTEDQVPFMVMEPLGKRSLRNILARQLEMSFESKVSIMMQATQGLAFAHKEGIVHRNLCPENIFLRANGCIKIRDFTVAHFLSKHLPHPGVRYGAPIYLSPEQIQHQPGNEQSDIFAAGIIFYELLTGVHPFYDADSNKALDNILNDRPVPTFESYPHFHPRIWHILKRCFAKKQEDRYRNADEMLQAFQALLKEMAEDVQFMLAELQSSFASLKATSEGPGASDKSSSLCRSIWNILRGIEDPDYVQLDMLMTDFNEIYPEIRASAAEADVSGMEQQLQVRPDDLYMFTNDTSPEKEKTVESFRPYAALHSTGEESGTAPQEMPDISKAEHQKGLEQESSTETHQKQAFSEDSDSRSESRDKSTRQTSSTETEADYPNEDPGVSDNSMRRDSVKSKQSSDGKQSSIPWRRFRIRKPKFRMIAVLILIILIIATVYVFQKSGDADTLFGEWKNGILNSWMTIKASVQKQSDSESAAASSISIVDVSIDDSSSEYESKLLDGLEESSPVDGRAYPARERLDRIRTLIRNGSYNQAEVELDRIRRVFPDSPEVAELYEEWRQKVFQLDPESKSSEKDQLKSTQKKEES